MVVLLKDAVKSARRRRNSNAQKLPTQMSVLLIAMSCTHAVKDESGEKARDSGVIGTSTHGMLALCKSQTAKRGTLPSRRDVPCT